MNHDATRRAMDILTRTISALIEEHHIREVCDPIAEAS